MLDMERQEVMALLENKKGIANTGTDPRRSSSPYTTVPRSPVRSMLDIEEEPASSSKPRAASTQAPMRSMLDVDAPVPRQGPGRSMLGPDNPSPPGSAHARSISPISPGSTGEAIFKTHSGSSHGSHHPRSSSDASFKPVEFGPRASGSRFDRTSEYQFSHILPQGGGGSGLPSSSSTKRLPQSSSSKRLSAGAMTEALRGADLSSLQLPGEGRRNSSITGRLGKNKSKSPHDRWSARSRSPATFSIPLAPGKVMLDDGQVVNISNAYRRLSDANLAFSSGSLSQLPMRKRSDDNGSGRLIKDYLGPDGEQLESSDEDEPLSSDDEDRGRKTAPRVLNPDARGEGSESNSRSRSGGGARGSLSLMAAADEERKYPCFCRMLHRELTPLRLGSKVAAKQSQKYTYRSMLEPEIKITNSSGDTVKHSKGGIHPHTSYDHNPTSATPSVVDSDEEADMDDIKSAQNLSFSMTNILTTAESHRSVRIIYRGDYNKIAQVAEDENQRLRKYLVATDLSDESTHALEWAIGTVLRDGDTLIAIYCVDEEAGIVTGDGALVPDDPKAMKEQAAALHTVANTKTLPAPVSPVTEFRRAARHLRSDSAGGSRTPASSPGPHRGDSHRAIEERYRAIQDMTDRLLKLLRKTRLQVRVIVEVLHCKNPRHLITEVIDLVNPTLVVIGSRGRSALKG